MEYIKVIGKQKKKLLLEQLDFIKNLIIDDCDITVINGHWKLKKAIIDKELEKCKWEYNFGAMLGCDHPLFRGQIKMCHECNGDICESKEVK